MACGAFMGRQYRRESSLGAGRAARGPGDPFTSRNSAAGRDRQSARGGSAATPAAPAFAWLKPGNRRRRNARESRNGRPPRRGTWRRPERSGVGRFNRLQESAIVTARQRSPLPLSVRAPAAERHKTVRRCVGCGGRFESATSRDAPRSGWTAWKRRPMAFRALARRSLGRPRSPMQAEGGPRGPFSPTDFMEEIWSGRRDSNPRPQPWQGCALPLSYTRIHDGRTVRGAYAACGRGLQPPRGADVGAAARGAIRLDLEHVGVS